MANDVNFRTITPEIQKAAKSINDCASKYAKISNNFLNSSKDVANSWVGAVSDEYVANIQALSDDLNKIVKYLTRVTSTMMEQKNNYNKANETVHSNMPKKK